MLFLIKKPQTFDILGAGQMTSLTVDDYADKLKTAMQKQIEVEELRNGCFPGDDSDDDDSEPVTVNKGRRPGQTSVTVNKQLPGQRFNYLEKLMVREVCSPRPCCFTWVLIYGQCIHNHIPTTHLH